MATAKYNGTTIARETQDKKLVHLERNVYFHIDAVRMEFLKENTHTSVCPAKGTANYYDVVVEGKTARNAAWVYRAPRSAYSSIEGRISFWNGVNVQRDAVASGAGGNAAQCCIIA